ncbi:pentapeptide repeat-containing protein [Nodosilinea sp. FACHB-13]|uniref:pentapeptide repeat-containing protein n=1 Tax=Cyanophyceae TaxID=3028117 RepID=UPI001686451F|nr:pentapeptide repeat-containing protein [Nodosilinea sp. FACHB-13]MBD2107581.1 pentapeptide repeat-containing protein [Nodosilinea sp. FACHB-13]
MNNKLSNRDLSGRNFVKYDLRGFVFSGSNIKSANFSDAILTAANFSQVRCGVKKSQAIFFLAGLFCLSALIGLGKELVITALLAGLDNVVSNIIIFTLSTTFLTVLVRQGFIYAILVAIVIAFTTAAIGIGFGVGPGLMSAIAAAAITGVLIVVIVSIGVIFLSVVGTIAFILSGNIAQSIVVFAVFAVEFLTALVDKEISNQVKVQALILTGSIDLVSFYIVIQALAGKNNFSFVRSIALPLAAWRGTSFQRADLTDADFSQATLKGADLRNAILIRACWKNVSGLNYALVGNSYLQHSMIRQLVTSLQGKGQNFDGLDLSGISLKDANLQDASFIGTNLNRANLKNADLSRAIMRQTQLDGANLTRTILTGAYIEDWGITSTTELENVQCEYVFMHVPTKGNPNPLRKPDNLQETFADGDFADFIKPYLDTLDLYHSQDVDPRAISIALKNLSTNHPDEELEFVAIERRGRNGLNLKFTTATRANKSELSREYFADYARIKKELPISVQLKLAERDAEIRTLKGTIEKFIQTGTHQSTVRAETIQVIQGELVVTENKGININAGGDIGNVGGLVGGNVSGVVNLGTISGNVTNTINQLADRSESDQPDLKKLLIQLQHAIQSDIDLPDPDKADLLEQVQALAEAGQEKEPAKKDGLMRKAMKMFDATLKSLPDTAKIVEACSKLLPLIMKALGT